MHIRGRDGAQRQHVCTYWGGAGQCATTGVCNMHPHLPRMFQVTHWVYNQWTIFPCKYITRRMWCIVGRVWAGCMKYLCCKYLFHSPSPQSASYKCSHTKLMKLLSRGWTLYTGHKKKMNMCTSSILSDTSKLSLYHSKPDPRGGSTHSHHSSCLCGCVHGWGQVVYIQYKIEKWHNLLH